MLSSKYYNLSFCESYVSWCDDTTNCIGDYIVFSTKLKRQAHVILEEFVRKDFDDYKLKKPDLFQNYCAGLKAEKKKSMVT